MSSPVRANVMGMARQMKVRVRGVLGRIVDPRSLVGMGNRDPVLEQRTDQKYASKESHNNSIVVRRRGDAYGILSTGSRTAVGLCGRLDSPI